jgi:hypothetical protein
MASDKDINKAVRLTPADQAIVETIRQRLGLRSVSEVLRCGLRSLAREQGLAVEPQPNKAA